MASHGSAERRANLIREMSKSSERSHSPVSRGSSAGSVGHNEQYATETQQLPDLPYESNFQINSSALKRAFPDFSQYGSSEEDSIELGRGIKSKARNTSNRNILSVDLSEDMSLNLGAAGVYRVTGTPPVKPRENKAAAPYMNKPASRFNTTARHATATKDSEETLEKITEYVSGGSNKSSQADPRPHAGLHARVDSDDSIALSDGRVSAATFSARNTRFSDRRGKTTSMDRDNAASASHAVQPLPSHTLTSTGNGTYQSFLLPDIPNITELVSGVRQDGTPLFPRTAKARSRFGTPSASKRVTSAKQTHIPVAAVPIPAEERALHVALQLLQEKVANLEKEKVDCEARMQDCELELLQLKSSIEEQEHRNQSNNPMEFDAGDAKANSVDRSVKTLQTRLDMANRKLAGSEITIANLTKDRDAAHQQLAMAYVSSEEVKSESQAVRNEIESVKRHLAQSTREHEAQISRLTEQELELRAKITRREQAVEEMGALARDLWNTRNALAVPKTSQLQANMNAEGGVPTEESTAAAVSARSRQESLPQSGRISNTGATRMRAESHLIDNAVKLYVPEKLATARPAHSHYVAPVTEANSTVDIQLQSMHVFEDVVGDGTYLSFMDGDEIPKLRQIVNEEKARLAESGVAVSAVAVPSTRARSKTSSTSALPRKSSLKRMQQDRTEYTGQSEPFVSAAKERPQDSSHATREPLQTASGSRPIVSFSHEKEDTQRSIVSQRSDRPRRSSTGLPAEITSAYILPDITLTDAMLNSKGWIEQGANLKQRMTVSRPVPVSDRMPVTMAGDDEYTIRPAQNPGLALAVVLKGLEEELSHLRAQLAEQEQTYNQHDPALSKRKRKIVYARIQKLLVAMETRADQIYALYDVLEGQKEKGQLMTEEEVDVTLQNIGVAPSASWTRHRPSVQDQSAQDLLNEFNAGDGSEQDSNGNEQGEDNDGDELPWEGIEPTMTHTLESLRGLRLRG